MGIRGNITRTNLAYANEHRDWRVYEALGEVLIRKVRRLCAEDSNGLDLDEMVYAVDASTIDLCLSMFPWAHFRKTKAAVKLHTQINLTGSIPVFMRITDGLVHDVHFMDQIFFEAGSIYVFDRGYLNFARLFRVQTAQAYFVIRAKRNTRFHVLESRPVDKSTGLRCDQSIRLSTRKGKRDYPSPSFPIRVKKHFFLGLKSGCMPHSYVENRSKVRAVPTKGIHRWKKSGIILKPAVGKAW